MTSIAKSLFIIILALASLGAVTQSYFSDTKVVAGNVFSTGVWSNSLINEVYYFGDKDWVELYNDTDNTITIKGWWICDTSDACGQLSPSKTTDILPGTFVVIAHSASDLKGDWTVPKDVERIYYAGPKISFDNPADSVLIKDENMIEIDRLDYATRTEIDESWAKQSSGFFEIDKPSPGISNF